MTADINRFKTRTLWLVLCFSFILTSIKFLAWHLTLSNAVLTDAMESIINVIAGGFALFCTYYASRPKDGDHPYGHGKIEYLSAGFEGGLIFIAGIIIIVRAVKAFFLPAELQQLDTGLYLLGFSGVCNYFIGAYLLKYGKKHNSAILIADGKHLLTDTISSAGVIVGLLIIHFTRILWLDNVIAIVYGAFIFRTGYLLLKSSINSLLDEADYEKLFHIIKVLNTNRKSKWIDMHNLRVLKYGSHLHIDCHITLPWYDNLEATHEEVTAVEKLIKRELAGEVEFFIHSDPCLPASCPICTIRDCKVRKAVFEKKLEWTMENMLPDKKHSLSAPA